MAANLMEIRILLQEYSGCGISVEPNYWMDPFYIDALPPSMGDACSLQILGCAPDFSVYGIDPPQRPNPCVYPYRTLGGHIHIEMGENFMKDRAAMSYLVAGLDLLIGTGNTYLCTSPQAFDRKKLYGQAGMVRAKDTIVEYRTLSAQALIQTPVVCELMFEAAQRLAGFMHDIYEQVPQEEAIQTFIRMIGDYDHLINTVVPAINSHDITTCRTLQEAFVRRLPSDAMLAEVISDMQRYTLPGDFDLHGWETI
jgi:hypothetical protein